MNARINATNHGRPKDAEGRRRPAHELCTPTAMSAATIRGQSIAPSSEVAQGARVRGTPTHSSGTVLPRIPGSQVSGEMGIRFYKSARFPATPATVRRRRTESLSAKTPPIPMLTARPERKSFSFQCVVSVIEHLPTHRAPPDRLVAHAMTCTPLRLCQPFGRAFPGMRCRGSGRSRIPALPWGVISATVRILLLHDRRGRGTDGRSPSGSACEIRG
jgi:hypothetical protein